MRGSTVQVAQVVSLFVEECCACGVVFGITSQLKQQRLDDHRTFHCPNGHQQHYTGESDAEKNARLLREEQARHARTIARANEADAARLKAERKLKRAARGVCTCCNRTFRDLQRHMATKHPEQAAA
jgi:hypothetical protein